MPGMLPARSEVAATDRAVTASEDTGEKSRSSPSPAPSGSTGAPGQTFRTGVAGKLAARAAVSMAGGSGLHRLPATVTAATAATAVSPRTAAARLDRLVCCSRRKAASRRRARSLEASSAGSVASTAGLGAGLSWLMCPPGSRAARCRDGQHQDDDAHNARDQPEPFPGRRGEFDGQFAPVFGQFKGLDPFGVRCGGFKLCAVNPGSESGIGAFSEYQLARAEAVGQFDVDRTVGFGSDQSDGGVVFDDAGTRGCDTAGRSGAFVCDDFDAEFGGLVVGLIAGLNAP